MASLRKIVTSNSNSFPQSHLWTLDAVDAVSKSFVRMVTSEPAFVVVAATVAATITTTIAATATRGLIIIVLISNSKS